MANISRKTFEQTGEGHFTPIGGFHEESDKVLLFDTARFKYPPHWVDVSLLYKAASTLDLDQNRMRGIITLSKKIKNEDNSKQNYVSLDHKASQESSKIFCQ